MSDRGRDAADIFSATVGFGIGAKARIGPLQAGLLAEADGIGLRGGTFPDVSDNRESWFLPLTCDLQLFLVGMEGFDSNSSTTSERHKDFATEPIGPFLSKVQKDKTAPYYYTQLETVIALGPSIRLGFNPGELLDFLLGWAGIDIFKDDIYGQPTYTHFMYDIQRDPDLLHELIVVIPQRPLTSTELRVVWQMVWKRGAEHDADIPVLLDYFQQDQSALGGIMANQNVTVEHLRLLYKRHKDRKECGRVLNELAVHPLTPDDILQALLTQKDRSVVEKAKRRLGKKSDRTMNPNGG